MFERVRELITSLTGRHDDGRFVSRAEREDRQRRILIISTAAVAIGVIVALVAGAIWQYFLVPRETYATVNGVDIRRADYEKQRIYGLLAATHEYHSAAAIGFRRPASCAPAATRRAPARA